MPTHPIQPPEWIDSASIRVEETIEIEASPVEVWKRVADHVSWPEWFTALERVDITGRATGVGGRRRVIPKSAKWLSIDEEFTAWEDAEHFAFAVTRTKLPILATMAESVRLEPSDAGCRVTYRQGLEARRGFGAVLGAVWRRSEAQLREALVNLKVLVEG